MAGRARHPAARESCIAPNRQRQIGICVIDPIDLAGLLICEPERPAAIGRHDKGMQGHPVAMATAEDGVTDVITTMPTPFAIPAGLSLDLQADRSSATLIQRLGGFPVLIKAPSSTDPIGCTAGGLARGPGRAVAR